VSAALDHLIVGADTLAQGAAYLEEKLGVAMQAGGRHLAMGTHNCVLRLGERVYLELIAIDPEGQAPAQLRWFGLDEEKTRDRLKKEPRLLTWAARTRDIDAAVAGCPLAVGKIHPMQRGAYRWRFTIPADGALVCDGLMPTLIEWDGDAHPADGLEDRGCSLVGMAGKLSAPEKLASVLARLGLENTLPLTRAQRAELAVTLRGPRGIYTLVS